MSLFNSTFTLDEICLSHRNNFGFLTDLIYYEPTFRSLPAPLSLCSVDGFDLVNNPEFCPSERNFLADFYVSAKGAEWTENFGWNDPYLNYCNWLGVSCNEMNNVIALELSNNGLSGKLSASIGNLSSLENLDLSDNDIKVRRESLPHSLCDFNALLTQKIISSLLKGVNSVGYQPPLKSLSAATELQWVHWDSTTRARELEST